MADEHTIYLQTELAEPVRTDIYLASQLTEFSRSRIQKLIDAGLVKIHGVPVKASLKLHGGEQLTVTVPADAPCYLAAQEIPLQILYEDDQLAVINKPAGLVVHPGAGVADGTLVNALLFHLGERLSGISGVLRPGIVHRLDKDTSGVLVVAKDDRAHRALAAQIRDKTARRVYLALVEGSLPEDSGVIDKPLGRHPIKRKQMAIVACGKPAVSSYQVIKRWPSYTLLRVSLQTGRTHQIRVHMSSLGVPVVGDIVYNTKRTGSLAAREKLGLLGHALHASYLSFTHPSTGALLEFEAAIPKDFQNLLDSL